MSSDLYVLMLENAIVDLVDGSSAEDLRACAGLCYGRCEQILDLYRQILKLRGVFSHDI